MVRPDIARLAQADITAKGRGLIRVRHTSQCKADISERLPNKRNLCVHILIASGVVGHQIW